MATLVGRVVLVRVAAKVAAKMAAKVVLPLR
jgi:hypothetical protein